MKKRCRRTGAARAPAQSGSNGLSRMPVELHRHWFRYLSQPELLRVSALSMTLRALVIDEPGFYLAVKLRSIRGQHYRFAKQLSHVSRRNLPIGIIIDLPYAPLKLSCKILASEVSPAIRRAMFGVRKLSITTTTQLPLAALQFLQTPAPRLYDFVYRIKSDADGSDVECDSAGDYSSDGYALDDWETIYLDPLPLPVRLFAGVAPRLTSVHLHGIALPLEPVPAFSNVLHANLCELEPIPALGLGAHFPAAKHMRISLDTFPDQHVSSCPPSDWLPARLDSLDLVVDDVALEPLLELCDVAAVPRLSVAFDAHYSADATFFIYNAGVRTTHRLPPTRDEAWAACLAHLAAPDRLEISSTHYDSSGSPQDLRVSVVDGARSVVFHASDGFCASRRPYAPLASLKCIAADLAEISIEHAHLSGLFSIAKTLPALVALRITRCVQMPFWAPEDDDDDDDSDPCLVNCPALELLEISGDDPGGVEVPPIEIVQFSRALGFYTTRERPAARALRVLGVRSDVELAVFRL